MTLIHLGPPVVFNRKEVVTLRKSKMPHDVQVCSQTSTFLNEK